MAKYGRCGELRALEDGAAPVVRCAEFLSVCILMSRASRGRGSAGAASYLDG